MLTKVVVELGGYIEISVIEISLVKFYNYFHEASFFLVRNFLIFYVDNEFIYMRNFAVSVIEVVFELLTMSGRASCT